MKALEISLEKALTPILADLFQISDTDKLIQFQSTRKDFQGDITLVVFPLLRYSKKSPEETGQIIGEALLKKVDLLSNFNVVKGFLNLEVSDDFWHKNLNQALAIKESFGKQSSVEKGGRRMVEFSSPNTNKPLHLGHLRNIFLGDSISRILKAAGNEVFNVQIINDRGIHICKSMLAWQKFGNGETPESSGTKGDHLVGKYYVTFDKAYKEEIRQLIDQGMEEKEAAQQAPLMKEARQMLQDWEAGKTEVVKLWEKLNSWVYEGFEQTYEKIGTEFDKLYYESDTYLIGKEKVLQFKDHPDFFTKEDGSFWVNLETEGLDAKILLRSDGTSVYITQDIGTAIKREEEFHCEAYNYVVGNEQDYHFKVLKLILQKMGFDWASGISHISYGMVDLPSGKMKSREGTVVDADDLMDEMKQSAADKANELGKIDELSENEREKLFHMIGMGALKYFILKVDPKKNMLFNPEESVDFNGNTGPFIQYTHARIKSILRKVDLEPSADQFQSVKLAQEDREVIKALMQFPSIIQEAAEQHSPALLANYLYALVKDFNHFYQNTPPLIKEEDLAIKQVRVNLCSLSAAVISRGMDLLGIGVPEQM